MCSCASARWLWQHTIHLFPPQKDTKMVWIWTRFLHTWFEFSVFDLLEVFWCANCIHNSELNLFIGRVQVALVWNSRNENSPNSDKLNALAHVRLSNSLSWFCSYWTISWLTTKMCFFIHLQFLMRKSGSKRKVPLIHSVWANFQTSTSNVSGS